MPHAPRKNEFYLDVQGRWTNEEPKPTSFMAPVGTPFSVTWSRDDVERSPEPWQGLSPVFRWVSFSTEQEAEAKASHGIELPFYLT